MGKICMKSDKLCATWGDRALWLEGSEFERNVMGTRIRMKGTGRERRDRKDSFLKKGVRRVVR